MLQKSLVTPSDVIIYDLEDSVAPSEEGKTIARERLTEFLTVEENPQYVRRR
jgi:citrate lyase subunit beta-like protein